MLFPPARGTERTGPATLEIIDFATTVIEAGSTVHTDGTTMFKSPTELGYTHVATPGYTTKGKASVLPRVPMVASLLKGWIIGTLHYRVQEHQLPYYVDEYTLRFNRRNAKSRGLLFDRLLEPAGQADPHPLRELIRPDAASISDGTGRDMRNMCAIRESRARKRNRLCCS